MYYTTTRNIILFFLLVYVKQGHWSKFLTLLQWK